MRIFFGRLFLILLLENAWAQDLDSLSLAWQIPQTLPTNEYLLVDGGSADVQSGASLLS